MILLFSDEPFSQPISDAERASFFDGMDLRKLKAHQIAF
jgi:hypothetical protein